MVIMTDDEKRRYNKILQRELDDHILDILATEEFNLSQIGRVKPEAYYEKQRRKIKDTFNTPVVGRYGIQQPSDLRARLEDRALNTFYKVKNATNKANRALKAEGQRLNEPEIVEVKPKQGVFSTLTQMALRAGRTFLPNQRAKVYADMSGVNM